MIQITLKDGTVTSYEQGISIGDVAKNISMGLYRNCLAGKVDGIIRDLRDSLHKDCTLELLTFDSPEGPKLFWHSTTHILAQAVKRLYPTAKLSVGPAVEGGFFYDFDVETPFTPEDLEAIQKEMKKIVKEAIPIERYYLPMEEALAWAEKQNEPHKIELIKEHGKTGAPLSFYQQGDFTDLCAGPHFPTTGMPKAIQLTQTTGAYLKGDAENKMLCRVYGVSFPKASMLESHLALLEEAKKRDHRKLGRELDLFNIFEEGPGFPFFFPKGMVLRNALENFWREEHRMAGYSEIKTPIILNRQLWETSGHWHHYKENMYTTEIDGNDFAIKPMNCPGGMLVYKRKPHSYRDLPQRVGELGLVHRHELSGALHGLMRVRNFTQDDAHIFMMPEQIKEEIIGVIALCHKFYNTFGFSYTVELSTQPQDSMGTAQQWETATNALKDALAASNVPYEINEGDGAFYGPKIDFKLQDCLHRSWQCGTIQLDFQLPERFQLFYTDPSGEKKHPVTIHRVVFGSIERFIGILTEHYAGAFPLWLSPVQVKVIPISERHNDYANQIETELNQKGFRVETDLRREKIGYKIREAQLEKMPYMLIVGDKELEENTLGIRSRTQGDLGAMTMDAFLEMIKKEIDDKVNPVQNTSETE